VIARRATFDFAAVTWSIWRRHLGDDIHVAAEEGIADLITLTWNPVWSRRAGHARESVPRQSAPSSIKPISSIL